MNATQRKKMKMTIRQATISDLETITVIYNQAIQSGRSTGDTELQKPADKLVWFQNHANEQFPLLVAEWKNKVVGWLSLSPYREGRGAFRFAAEVSYFIDSHFHRKGVTTALLEKAEFYCRSKGTNTLVAFLLAHNKPSIALLKKFGFSLWGTLPKIANIKGIEYDHVFYGRRLF